MNLRKHATKIVTAGLALAVAVPTVAMAAHPFDDVPDDQWYTDSVHWAYDNGLTTGKTPTTFAGMDATNRYEVVTFFDRYHNNMVAPELADEELGLLPRGEVPTGIEVVPVPDVGVDPLRPARRGREDLVREARDARGHLDHRAAEAHPLPIDPGRGGA